MKRISGYGILGTFAGTCIALLLLYVLGKVLSARGWDSAILLYAIGSLLGLAVFWIVILVWRHRRS